MKIFLACLATLTLILASPNRPNTRENFPCTSAFPDQVQCNPSACSAANDCVCFGTEPNIPVKERPQIVYLTYDDGFTALAHNNYYEKLFQQQYENPNGCPIRASHFLTHQSTDYSLVNKYYNLGHEMSIHSITHRSNTTYWRTMNQSSWENEMVGMRQIISKFAKIPADDLVGIRVPYLQIGGDEQFAMMHSNNFLYDCSRPSLEYGFTSMGVGVWPYTLDFKDDLDCQIDPCPRCSYSGTWVQPMLDLEDSWFIDGVANPCAMLDSCIINVPNPTKADVFEMLQRNFERAYNGTTRAPFGLYMHAAWFFGGEYRFEGYKMFLDYITQLEDVWVVPVRAGIEYRKNPKTNDELLNGDLEAFNCDQKPPIDCTAAKNCRYDVNNEDIKGEVYMKICGSRCPINYPWLGNPEGI